MKTNKKEIKKFDLEKFEVAKLKNLRTIVGGDAPGDDKTITDVVTGGNNKNT
ncbi:MULTISPECIES: hypothetical protein [Flavobacterium]|uniref:Uncharacterized protein n=1 Tax=Flavobacterium panici TaxID=2654843 RepID=A0A9N8P3I5_9FLAO|nr:MULTISPECIES: hypothetical protein [Flavobacterium]UUF16453.1 hypothetical protein NLJ00_10090 [Flavobacterium panici]CAC9976187.1 hypothetical protein FLAPXU55_03911 [Flavobacterium panici]